MQNYWNYLDILIRSLIAFIVLFLLTRLMGKKLISQLTFFDYVSGIAIGSVAATLSVDERVSFLHGIISLIVWGVLPVLAAFIPIKSMTLRRLSDGVPTVFIQNGKIITNNLLKEKFNINDLLQELRLKGVFDISDVEFAILETDGEVSVNLKTNKRPLTPSDLNINTNYEGLCANLIIDGKIMRQHLKLVNLTEEWLMEELKKRNITSIDEIILASLNTKGELFISLKNENLKVQNSFE